jgi:hypothetical protein
LSRVLEHTAPSTAQGWERSRSREVRSATPCVPLLGIGRCQKSISGHIEAGGLQVVRIGTRSSRIESLRADVEPNCQWTRKRYWFEISVRRPDEFSNRSAESVLPNDGASLPLRLEPSVSRVYRVTKTVGCLLAAVSLGPTVQPGHDHKVSDELTVAQLQGCLPFWGLRLHDDPATGPTFAPDHLESPDPACL